MAYPSLHLEIRDGQTLHVDSLTAAIEGDRYITALYRPRGNAAAPLLLLMGGEAPEPAGASLFRVEINPVAVQKDEAEKRRFKVGPDRIGRRLELSLAGGLLAVTLYADSPLLLLAGPRSTPSVNQAAAAIEALRGNPDLVVTHEPSPGPAETPILVLDFAGCRAVWGRPGPRPKTSPLRV